MASDQTIQKRIAMLFSDEYDYFYASAEACALERLKTNEISVVCIYKDCKDSHCFALISEFKRDSDIGTIPVVFISDEDQSAQQQALSAGADAFLTFAYDPEISRLYVRNMVDRYISHVLMPRKQLYYEQMVNQCLKLIYAQELSDETFAQILKLSADYMRSERAYAFRRQGNYIVCFSEYRAPGIPPQKEELNKIELSVMYDWEKLVGEKYYICIDNAEDIQFESPVIYQRLISQGIKRMAFMLFRVDGKVEGVIGYDNPTLPIEALKAYSENIFLFLNLAMDKSEREKRLNFATYHDSLTGLLNRSCFRKDLERLDQTGMKKAGILYIDLNGLKEVNDHQSHAAGDRLLARCAEALRTLCHTMTIYRVGGDEFIVIMPEMDEMLFVELSQEIKTAFGVDSLCRAAVGEAYWHEGEDFEAKVICADNAMYEDKARYYKQEENNRRNRRS